MRKTLLTPPLRRHGRREAQSRHQSLFQSSPKRENKWQRRVLKILFICCSLQLWWAAVRLWPRTSENALLTAQLCLFIIFCFMGILIRWAGGGPKLSWVLGMLYKEKFHCFHCEILPQATSECSREDTHHFQQNSWQIHLLLLVIFGAIFKSLRNIRSYSPSEKPSSPHRTTAKEGETTNFCSIFLNFKGKLLLKYLNTDEHEVWRNCYWVTMSFPRNIDAQEGNFRST